MVHPSAIHPPMRTAPWPHCPHFARETKCGREHGVGNSAVRGPSAGTSEHSTGASFETLTCSEVAIGGRAKIFAPKGGVMKAVQDDGERR